MTPSRCIPIQLPLLRLLLPLRPLIRLPRPINANHVLQRRQKAPRRRPRSLRQHRIHNHQRRHRLHDRHRARHNARVVPPLCLQHARRLIVHCRRLRLPDRGRGLERHCEVDVRAVGDAALDTARVVGLGCQAWFGLTWFLRSVGRWHRDEGVVVDRARDLGTAEAGPDLEALGRGDAEHGVREGGFEFVEAGLA